MGADKLAENTPNAPKFICPICLPKTKSLDFNEKRLYPMSVVRAIKPIDLSFKSERLSLSMITCLTFISSTKMFASNDLDVSE